MEKERTERTLHQAYWGIQTQVREAEVAIQAARDLAYAVLKADPNKDGAAAYMADNWIERYGRDAMREIDVEEAKAKLKVEQESRDELDRETAK